MFNILVVDDDINIRRHVRSICLRAGDGVGIFEAVDSQEALTVLEDNIIQLCIMDIHLPDMLGTDLLRIVKQQYGGIKVIMLSGDSSFDAVRQSFLYSADDYVAKPVDEMALLRKVCDFRRMYFLGLNTIELPKKKLSEYIPISLNAEFAAVSEGGERKYEEIKEKYGLDFEKDGGRICSMTLGGLENNSESEYYYSFLAERIKREFSDSKTTFFYFDERMLAIINNAGMDFEAMRKRFTNIKSVFNDNSISLSVFISVEFNEDEDFYSAYSGVCDIVRKSEMYGKNEIVYAGNVDSSKNRMAVAQRAKRYIQDMLYESFSLVNVAEYLNIHPNYLSKVFKQSEGVSFTDYVCDCKMREAKRLLKETNLKIYTIAEKLHYYDTGYFIRIFKKYYGLSPNQFRRSSE